MATTPWVPIIKSIIDGTDKVSAEVMNPILKSYTDRTQHLYEKFADLGDKSVIIAFDQLVVGSSVAQYSVVYYDFELTIPGLVLAKPAFATSTYATQYRASKSAFTFGIIKSAVPGSGDKIVDVYLQGLVQVTGIVTAMLDSSSDNVGFVGGPLFMSSKDAGKLTSVPGGQAIYVGYAKNLDEIYLNPSYESFNDFFFSFKYALLDRPAGTPSLSSSTWTISNATTNRVGWIPADFNSTVIGWQPINVTYGTPLFFYNIPSTDALIDADDGLTSAEKSDAKALRRSLPPNPASFTFLSVNGVIQEQKVPGTDVALGIYVVNEFGIWWYSNADDSQPWAKDLNLSIALTTSSINTSTDVITLNSHGFEDGDVIKFFIVSGSGANLPSGLTAGISYTINSSTTNTFKLTGVDLTSVGAGTFYIEWQPEAWSNFRGSEYLRVRMMLQFTKVNPDYKTAVVTSLKPSTSPNSTKSIKFVNSTGDVQSTGDLQLQFDLNKTSTTESPLTGTAVKDIDYNSSTGDLEVKTGPVVTSVLGLGVAKATTDSAGQCTITVENTNLSNLVTSLEVEQARLEYTGLHSYLTTDYNLLPAGFVGKFLLPAQLPSADLQFKIILFGKTGISASKTKVKFQFSYAITKPNTVITSAVAALTTITIDLGSTYVANTCTVFTPVEFVIPRAALVEGGVVNFRLTRVKPSGGDVTSNYYDTSVSIVGTYWNLG